MIKISGQTTRNFTFPAPLDTAFGYYSDLNQLLAYLPYIEVVDVDLETNHFRAKYSTKELGTYEINILCDLTFEIDMANYALHVRAVDRLPVIKPRASLSSTEARGYFTCDSYFTPGETIDQTAVEYNLTIHSKLPRPTGLRFMPGRVVSGIASGITNGRMKEIADGFIQNSIASFEQIVR
jgi:hypothetical protein